MPRLMRIRSGARRCVIAPLVIVRGHSAVSELSRVDQTSLDQPIGTLTRQACCGGCPGHIALENAQLLHQTLAIDIISARRRFRLIQRHEATLGLPNQPLAKAILELLEQQSRVADV
jgi:hypothetical protein